MEAFGGSGTCLVMFFGDVFDKFFVKNVYLRRLRMRVCVLTLCSMIFIVFYDLDVGKK